MSNEAWPCSPGEVLGPKRKESASLLSVAWQEVALQIERGVVASSSRLEVETTKHTQGRHREITHPGGVETG